MRHRCHWDLLAARTLPELASSPHCGVLEASAWGWFSPRPLQPGAVKGETGGAGAGFVQGEVEQVLSGEQCENCVEELKRGRENEEV